MKLTILSWLLCVTLLVGSGVWIGSRSNDEESVRRKVIQELAQCTIEKAHKDECWLPCASDDDCLKKNGQSDH